MVTKPDIIIASNDDFAILRRGRPLVSASWEDVSRIRAYKRDELTADLICLDVQLRNGTSWFLHEEALGWEDFLDAAQHALPGMRAFPSWFPAVAQPAFARNEQIIFDRRAFT